MNYQTVACLGWPVNRPYSQGFGENPPLYLPYGMEGHNGIDFAGLVGDDIYFNVDGTGEDGSMRMAQSRVIHAGRMAEAPALGIVFMIHTPDKRLGPAGAILLYAHLEHVDPFWRPGNFIPVGRKIGTMGNTGRSTGPHLHFAVMPCASYIDFHDTPKNEDEGRVTPKGRIIWNGSKPDHPIDWRGAILNRNNGYLGCVDPLPLFSVRPEPVRGYQGQATDEGEYDEPVPPVREQPHGPLPQAQPQARTQDPGAVLDVEAQGGHPPGAAGVPAPLPLQHEAVGVKAKVKKHSGRIGIYFLVHQVIETILVGPDGNNGLIHMLLAGFGA